jgi:hypothetical protein
MLSARPAESSAKQPDRADQHTHRSSNQTRPRRRRDAYIRTGPPDDSIELVRERVTRVARLPHYDVFSPINLLVSSRIEMQRMSAPSRAVVPIPSKGSERSTATPSGCDEPGDNPCVELLSFSLRFVGRCFHWFFYFRRRRLVRNHAQSPQPPAPSCTPIGSLQIDCCWPCAATTPQC